MIERYLVRYFLAVVDHGSFSGAARQCGVSQPTLSAGIAKLEQLLGHILMHRTNRRIELTTAGTRFAVHARRIEAEFARAQQIASGDQRQRRISVGVIPSLPSSWIECAAQAATGIADEQLELVEGRMQDLLPRLTRGRIAAIIGPTGNDPRARTPFFEEGYAMVVPDAHRLAGRETIAADEVADEPMIVRRNCEALADVSRYFTARGVRPFFSARTINDDRALALVRSGLGITVMPRCFAASGVSLIELTGFEQTRRIGLIVDPESARRVDGSAALDAFGQALRRLAQVSAPIA